MSVREILSPEEIDSLLEGVDSGIVAADAAVIETGVDVEPFEFGGGEHIVRGELPTLEMIYERFTRRLHASLFGLLRRTPNIVCGEINLLKYGEYVSSLFEPASLNLVSARPLLGTAQFNLDAALVSTLVDSFFGGTTQSETSNPREFTDTDMRVVQRVLALALDDLRIAWQPVLELELEYLESETNPHFAGIVSPSEVVVSRAFSVEIEGSRGTLHITLPYSMIEPIREQLTTGVQSDRGDQDGLWSESLRRQIEFADVVLSTTLAEKESTLRELLVLRPGEILEIEVEDYVVARVENVPLFHGKFGVSRGNLALKVLDATDTGSIRTTDV